MNIIATVALLQLCLSATVSDNSIDTTLTAELGDPFILPCFSVGNSTLSSTKWTKDGREIGNGGGATPFPATVLQNGSLRIEKVVAEHEGIYLCSSTLPDKSTLQARALLRVASGPHNISTLILPVVTLSNGTLITNLGTSVHFYCSSSSYPSQRLSWTFSGAPSNKSNTLNSTSQLELDYRIKSIQPSDQGLYTCSAINTVSNRTVNKSSELLVYYIPQTHPDCMWVLTQDLSYVELNCSWLGTYPSPKLCWGDKGDFQETDNLSVRLNSSEVFDGKKMTCTARHTLLHEGNDRSCSITLKAPYPIGDPVVTALEGSSITLTCTEATAVPKANTTWRKGMQQTLITSGSKYVLSENIPVYKLTILNVSKDDEDFFFCHSQNQLSIVELEVHLIVKKSCSAYTGVIIGVFISALIIGSAVVVARLLYSKRHQICLGYLGDEDRGDVLSLVDSDDEQIFQDTVPQLPPLANGHQTTLVEIHRIPSCDHEEGEIADMKPQQPEDTEQTEQSEDLVTL